MKGEPMWRWTVAIVLLTAGFAWAQPALQAKRVMLAPRIDGVLDDACWDRDFAGGFTTVSDQQRADPQTSIAIAFDAAHLYVAVRCDEPHMDELVEAAQVRDGPVYRDDAVELMLMATPQLHPDPNYIEYAHLIINTTGVQQDRLLRGGATVPWDGIWQSAVNKGEDGWTAELAIPFASLPIDDQTTSVWRFNITRQRKANRTQLSAFAPVRNNFHTPGEFATLTGVDVDFDRFRIDVTGVDVSATGGACRVEVRFRNDGALDGPARVEAALIGPDERPRIGRVITTTRPDSSGSVDIGPFSITDGGEYDVFVRIIDGAGAVRRQAWQKRTIDVSPLRLTMRQPWYRHSIYATQNIEAVIVDAAVNLPPDRRAAHELVAVLEPAEGGAAVGAEETLAIDGDHVEVVLPLPDELADGEYRVVVSMRQGDQQVTAQSLPLHKLPPAPGREVRLDEHRNVVIDGEPFFPLGFMGASVNRLHLAERGYNTLHMYGLHYEHDIGKVRAVLDRFEQAGVKAIFYPWHRTPVGFSGRRVSEGEYRPYFTDEEIDRVLHFVRELRDHPALLGWYVCDEPRGAAWRQTLEQMYQRIAEADPYHPVIALDNGPHGCIDLQDSADIVWLDPYPDFLAEGGTVRPMDIVSRGIDTVQQGIKRHVGVWLAQQTFDRGDFRPNERDKWRSPTYIEERCMAYMGLVEGAKAIIPYKIGDPNWQPGAPTGNRGIYSSAEMRIGMLEGVGPELAQLAPVVLLPESPRDVECDQDQIITLLKEDDGHVYLVAVNTAPEPCRASIAVQGLGARDLHVFWEDRTVRMRSGVLEDQFSGFAVHVYTDDPDLRSDRTVSAVQAMISQSAE